MYGNLGMLGGHPTAAVWFNLSPSVGASPHMVFVLANAQGVFSADNSTSSNPLSNSGTGSISGPGVAGPVTNYIVELQVLLSGVDTDGDGIDDAIDNCLAVANPAQADADLDQLGDACDPFPNDVDHEKAQCFVDLGESNAALFQSQLDFASCSALRKFTDADGDGEDDGRDRCPGTPTGTAVDGDGCSRAQFCAVRASTCKKNDWMNDEAGVKKPGDCTHDERARTCS